MRPLTIDEKAKSQTARKLANKALADARKKIGAYTWDQHYRMVKGSPVKLQMDGQEIVLNYELLRGMYQKLKRRYFSVKIENQTLIIVHHVTLWGRDKGSIELYELPDYQKHHLIDLPTIELNTD